MDGKINGNAKLIKFGGLSIVVGAVLQVVTMVLHPSGHDVALGRGASSLMVHSLALLASTITFYGALSLTRWLSPTALLAELALVMYGAAVVAAIMAATASGFLAPGLIAGAMEGNGASREVAAALAHYNFGWNQAFAKILVAASSLSIALWSIELLRAQPRRHGLGGYGLISALIVITVLLTGNLRLDVHGFGAVVVAQAIWLVLVGVGLCRVKG